MKLLLSTLLSMAALTTALNASTLDFRSATFATTVDGASASETIDGVTFTLTPVARGADGFRQNTQGLQFGIPGNGMSTLAITADADVTFTSMSGVDNSILSRTTPGLFNATAGSLVAFTGAGFPSGSGGSFDFADVSLAAGDVFTLIYDFSVRPGFEPVFNTTTLTSLDFDIDSVTTTPVPLPAGAPLLLGGLAVFGAVRRKKTR